VGHVAEAEQLYRADLGLDNTLKSWKEQLVLGFNNIFTTGSVSEQEALSFFPCEEL